MHVHNDAGSTKTTVKTSPAAAPAPGPSTPPPFTGVLFGWEDHYKPIVKRFAAKAELEHKKRNARAFFRRREVLVVMAVLVTLAALSCRYLQSSGP